MTARDVFGIVGTTQAGNFHVERVVAEGGFGVVYRALHGGFRAPVAIKCLKIPEQMSKQQRAVFLEKFREEAELMFRLSAAITEVCRPLHVDVLLLADGRFVPFLALEWLEGESLDGIITRRREAEQPPLGLHKVVKMMRPIAAALAKAHRFPGPNGTVSIIHRDLKPENIFAVKQAGSEAMKILDYGIAKAKRSASQAAGRITGRTLEEDEQASFTPAYGAPEQWSPKTYGETGPWTDIWGLGLSMVETLCGAPVIDGDTYVMRRTTLDEKCRPTPRNHGAEVPIEVERVFEKALAVDPRKRYHEVESFYSDLERAMGLPPSLGPRDSRREPNDVGKIESLSAHSMQLAKIALAKMPADGGFDAGTKKVSIEGKPGAPAAKPPIAPPPARKPEPSGNWEFDLEGSVSTGPQAQETSGFGRPRLPSSSSMELEMHLPTESEPPPAHALMAQMRRSFSDLEAVLPTSEPGPASARLGMIAPAPGSDLEAALPTLERPSNRPPPSSRRATELGVGARVQAMMAAQAAAAPVAPAAVHAPVMLQAASVATFSPQAAPNPALAWQAPVTTGPQAAPNPALAWQAPVTTGPQAAPNPALAWQAPVTTGPQAAPNPAPAWQAPPPAADPPSGIVPPSAPRSAAAPVPPRPVSAPAVEELSLDLEAPARPSRAEVPLAINPMTPIHAPALPPPASSFDAGPSRRDEGTLLRPRPHAHRSVGDRLRAPLAILLFSLAVALLDFGYHKLNDGQLMLGPVRPFWIAAPLALIGVGFTLWRLMEGHEDE